MLEDSLYKEFICLKCLSLWQKSLLNVNNFSIKQRKARKANIQYLLAILGHNAHVEQAFFMFSFYAKERNAFNVKTIDSIIQFSFSYKIACIEFYNYVMKKKNS